MDGTTTTATLEFFFSAATSTLTWLISAMETALVFMLDNPICFIGLIVSLVIAAIGSLRHIIGG